MRIDHTTDVTNETSYMSKKIQTVPDRSSMFSPASPAKMRISLLALLSASWAFAPIASTTADDSAETPSQLILPPTDLSPADQARAQAALALRLQIGDFSLLHASGRGLLWQHGPHQVVIEQVDEQYATVASQLGSIQVALPLLQTNDSAHLQTFVSLLSLAEREGLPIQPGSVSGLRYQFSPLTGLRLIGQGVVVIPEGVLRQVTDSPDRANDINTVETAVQALLARLPEAGLDSHGQQTVEHLLAQLSLPQPLDLEGDEVDPEFSRGLLRHGWLAEQLPDHQDWPEVSALQQAVESLETKRPAVEFRGEAGVIQQLGDAFGNGGWMIRTAERCSVALTPSQPLWHWPAQDTLADAMLIIDFPLRRIPAVISKPGNR